jgi:hypothetical protein
VDSTEECERRGTKKDEPSRIFAASEVHSEKDLFNLVKFLNDAKLCGYCSE